MTNSSEIDLSILHFEFDATTTLKEPSSSRRRRLLSTTRSPSSSSTSIHNTPPHLLASISSHTVAKPTPTKSNSSSSSSTSITSTALPPGTILPFGLDKGPHARRYLWDGHCLIAVDLQDVETVAANSANTNSAGAATSSPPGRKFPPSLSVSSLQNSTGRWLHAVQAAFFPNPGEVTPDYWEWCKWRAVHRIFSSMASVFGTQSLLLAVGLGAKRTLPAAAAINWVLKDGLGRLGRLSVATKFGESFDSDLKRFRFSSSLLYAGALTMEYMTPLFPQYFLPLAAVANVGKSVGLTTYISTQPAFHRSFATSENLADISAKSQAQQMAVDTVGLAMAVTLSALCARHSEVARRTLPLVALPFLAGGDLLAISHELRSIHLRTLNKERAEIIAAEWLRTGKVPSPKQVSAKERLILPPEAALGPLPLKIGGLEDVLTSATAVERFLKQPPGQKYALSILPPPQISSDIPSKGKSTLQQWLLIPAAVKKQEKGAVRAALRSDAAAEDVLSVILRTAKLRAAVEQRRQYNSINSVNSSSSTISDWGEWLEDSEKVAAKELAPFLNNVKEAGWQVCPFMLSSAEKKIYYRMNDW